jgi:excisionase family DNA binding protein
MNLTNVCNMTEAASQLQCSTKTIQRWMRQGKLSGVRYGNMVLISQEELDRVKSELAK